MANDSGLRGLPWVLLRQVGHRAYLTDGVCQGLLAVDMLAHLHGGDGCDGVDVVRSADDNGIDMLVYAEAGLPIAGGVPEPATWIMFLLGFGAVGWTLRSRGSRMSTTA